MNILFCPPSTNLRSISIEFMILIENNELIFPPRQRQNINLIVLYYYDNRSDVYITTKLIDKNLYQILKEI